MGAEMTRYLIAWDWDNTLMDTTKAIEMALNDTLSYYKMPPATRADLLDVMGHHKGAFWIRHFPTKIDEAFAYMISRFSVYHKNAFLFKQALDILSFVQSQGVQQIVVSNKPQSLLEEEVAQTGTHSFFTNIVGTRLLSDEKKPFASFGAQVLSVLQYDKLIMIGDGEADMIYAQNVGAMGIYVQTPDNKVPGIKYDCYFENLDQLFDWLKELLGINDG